MTLGYNNPVGSGIFALLIGINNYTKHGMALQGAKNDVEALSEYLQRQLDVPEDRIVCLLNDSATRENILQAFKDLAANPVIKRDDPILIFYAGHGTRIPSPKEWTLGPEKYASFVEAIVPRDFSQEGDARVDVIPDRTIDVLIRNIHDSKGDNILVIFDCCYSGSANRTDYIRPRGWTFAGYAIGEDLDRELIHTLRQKINRGNGALNTHVFLAACASDEKAMEYGDRGVFTSALLRVLTRYNINELTYARAISLATVVSHSQHPECIGNKSNRLFLRQTLPDGWEHCFSVTRDSDGQYTVEAGTINGISDGAEFDLYKMQVASGGPDGAPLLRMVASPVGPWRSSLQPPTGLHPDQNLDIIPVGALVAKQVTAGQTGLLTIYCDSELNNEVNSLSLGDKGIEIRTTDNEEDSFLSMHPEGNEHLALTVRVRDPEALQWRLADCLSSTDRNQLRVVLTAVARFHHLLNFPTGKKLSNLTKFKIAFNELTEKTTKIDAFEEPFIVKHNLYENGKAEIIIDDSGNQKPYGVSLYNDTQTSFWATVLFFGCSDFSIEHLCRVRFHSKTELRVGFGGGSGTDPFTFSVPDGQEMDIGYFKVVLSTDKVDLAHLSQPSPFTPGEDLIGDVELGTRKAQKSADRPPFDYGAIHIPVVLRRAHN